MHIPGLESKKPRADQSGHAKVLPDALCFAAPPPQAEAEACELCLPTHTYKLPRGETRIMSYGRSRPGVWHGRDRVVSERGSLRHIDALACTQAVWSRQLSPYGSVDVASITVQVVDNILFTSPL